MTNPYLELFEKTGNANTARRKIEIFKGITRLGRERGVEVEITLEAANVSRRHAEIRRQNNSSILVDGT
jgi:pSer/pThr/pTyr-binding forkhead associated (FHA) protein